MIALPVLTEEAAWIGMLKNWVCVYFGNLAGALLLAAGLAAGGQLNLGGGALALHTIRTAAAKCALPFGGAVILGVFCNVLVCIGVLCSLSAKDTAGRIAGAYLPVAFFVICGFEHSVANMYYIPAGIFALGNPEYAALAASAGLNTAALGWGRFLWANLLPVTLGNIIGGAGVAILLWLGHCGGRRGSPPSA
jgi:formate/nitrite transporter